MIPSRKGTQIGLDELGNKMEFQKELNEVVEARKLVPRDVWHCVHHIYHEVSKHASDNECVILARAEHFNDSQRAVLVAFLRMQDQWGSPLAWKDVELPRKVKVEG